MNAQDLVNIKWTLDNGQTHERIKMLQLISQILELSSDAMSNANEYPTQLRQRAYESRSRSTNENRLRSNDPLASTLERSESSYEDETSTEIFRSSANEYPTHLRQRAYESRSRSTNENRLRSNDPLASTLERSESSYEDETSTEIFRSSANEYPTHLRQRAYESRSRSTNENRLRSNDPLASTLERSESSYEDETSTEIFRSSANEYPTHLRQRAYESRSRSTNENRLRSNDPLASTLERSESSYEDETSTEIFRNTEISQPSVEQVRNHDDSSNLIEIFKLDAFADVIAFYEEHGRFDKITQKQFMRILTDELLKGPRLSNEKIDQISHDVCLTFVTEEKTSYYDKQPGLNPTGTFFNMYRNGLKKDPAPKKSRKRKAQDSRDEETLDLDAFSDKIKESVNYFKKFQEENNAEIVNSHWSASYSYRRAALRKKSFENITYMFNNWPVLKTDFAHQLMNFDFKKEHGPLCSESLIKNWTFIVRSADDLYSMISKNNKRIRSLLLKLPSKDINYDNVVLSKALHYLIPPRATVHKFPLTMDASVKSFYQFARSVENLEEKIKERSDYCLNRKIESYPIIFGFNGVSNIQYVVVMENYRFYFNEFLKAFDTAFKLIIFFNIPFPPESLKFWSIINSIFYDLNHGAPITGSMYSVIHKLKEHIKISQKSANSRSRSKSRSRSNSRSRSRSNSRSRSRSNSRARSNSPIPSTSTNEI